MNELPPPARLFRAVRERDAAFEGVFVFGVRTTGVFCRPGCGARTPREANCRFFATAEAALRAGFRPCLRCRPLEPAGRPDPLVARLLEWVEERLAGSDGAAEPRIADLELRALGIEPSTARRRFRARCGLTFQAYQRARRLGSAAERLRAGGDVAEAAEVAGFGSFSGFHDAFRAQFGAPTARAGSVRVLRARSLETPLGPLLAVADEERLELLEFEERGAPSRELERLQREAAVVPGDNALLRGLARELARYFAGERVRFETPLHLRGTPFQVRVWSQLCAIPPGTTRSYRELAEAVGKPKAVRAVGRANALNRLVVVVPCHRVIGADGSLVGYGGSLWRKRRLLELERGEGVEGRAASAEVGELGPAARR